jgi:uncharacterized protein YfaP (DUF2135 family)
LLKDEGISAILIIIVAVVIAVVTVVTAVGLYFLLEGTAGGTSPTLTTTPTTTPTTTTAPTSTTTAPALEQYGVVMGRVIDAYGRSLGGVTVAVGGKTGETNNQGWFTISDVASSIRALVTFSKEGYVTTQKITEVRVGESSFIDVAMVEVGPPQSLNAVVGGTITQGGGSVTIEANSLVDAQGNPFTGVANISLTPFDPTIRSHLAAFPGRFAGLVDGEERPFESYGFMDVTVTGSGLLHLAPGKSATIEIPIPEEYVEVAPNTIDLWYYDTADGYWKKEETATKVGGVYRGTVTHFSTWNADLIYQQAYIMGRVVDADGNPQARANVFCDGLDYSGRSVVTTGSDGRFRVPVRPNSYVQIWASKGGRSSDLITEFTPANPGGEADIGDIVIMTPVIQITLTWGADPSDLDSHLTTALVGGVSFHVWYDEMGSFTSEPYAGLDTDDVDSYGPEVTSISKLRQGTYRFSVRHYAGDGTIATSGAKIDLVIQGVGIYSYAPPAAQPEGTDIWRVFDIVVDSAGNIAAVNPINDYVTGGDTSELLYP